MPTVRVTIHLPNDLWRAVQALAPEEGDANTVILRALEEYITATAKRRGHRSGKYQKLVQALSTPVAALNLSARPASTLKMLNVNYVYELVQKSQLDLFRLPNFGEKSLREVKEKLANLGLTLGMTLEDDAYRAAVVAAVVANIATAKG
jgi:DNA-directed RNA polymerase alpha subunit